MTDLSGLPLELRKAAKTTEKIADIFVRIAGEKNQREVFELKWVPAGLAAQEMVSREAVKKALDWLFNEVGRLRDSNDNISIHDHADALLEVREKLGFDPYEAEKEEG